MPSPTIPQILPMPARYKKHLEQDREEKAPLVKDLAGHVFECESKDSPTSYVSFASPRSSPHTPTKEISVYFASCPSPSSMALRMQTFSSRLCACLGNHQWGALLDTPFANILSLTSSLPEGINAVLSTYPALISKDNRLKLTDVMGVLLFTMSFGLAAMPMSEDQITRSNHHLNQLRLFSNNFNFCFDTLCRLIGEEFRDVYPNDTLIDCLSGGIVVLCLLYGLFMAFQVNPMVRPTCVPKVLMALASTFATGTFIYNVLKLTEFCSNRDVLAYSATPILIAQFGSLIFYGFREHVQHKDLHKATQRLSTLNNLFTNINLFLENYETQDVLDIVFSSVKFSFIGLCGVVSLACPTFFRAFKRPREFAEHRQPIFTAEALEAHENGLNIDSQIKGDFLNHNQDTANDEQKDNG
jgi:hypothetical protein